MQRTASALRCIRGTFASPHFLFTLGALAHRSFTIPN